MHEFYTFFALQIRGGYFIIQMLTPHFSIFNEECTEKTD